MGNRSITDKITDKLFGPLQMWAEESTANWNILVGIGFVLVMFALIWVFILIKKMGKPDERTNEIQLKSAFIMLFAIVICDIFFPKVHMWQIFFLFKYAIAFLAAGIYLTFRYKKDIS